MKLSDIMSAAGLASWAEIGLVVSFLTFAAVVAWLLLNRRSRWEHVARLPLEDDTPTGPHVEHGGSR